MTDHMAALDTAAAALRTRLAGTVGGFSLADQGDLQGNLVSVANVLADLADAQSSTINTLTGPRYTSMAGAAVNAMAAMHRLEGVRDCLRVSDRQLVLVRRGLTSGEDEADQEARTAGLYDAVAAVVDAAREVPKASPMLIATDRDGDLVRAVRAKQLAAVTKTISGICGLLHEGLDELVNALRFTPTGMRAAINAVGFTRDAHSEAATATTNLMGLHAKLQATASRTEQP